MTRLFNRNSINFTAIFQFNDLEKPIQKHLRNVYSVMAIGLLMAALGAYVHCVLQIIQAGMLSGLVSLGLMLALLLTPHSRENIGLRVGYFSGFAFFTGLGLGPLLTFATDLDPTIVPTAFFLTGVIFVSFTMNALLTNKRAYLYMGSTLMSLLLVLFGAGFLNLFIRSPALFSLQLYLGLGLFCAFILFDTQLMIEKRRRGDEDFIWHALDLFLDLIQVFRHLVMIMAKKNRRNSD